MKGIVVSDSYSGICAVCGRVAEARHHLIFGIRKGLADKDGLTIPLCHKCHNMGAMPSRIHDNPMAERLSKMLGQLAWEKECYRKLYEAATGNGNDTAREYFRGRYGKSYL